MADARVPLNPILGAAAQFGDATHPGFVQLKNPTGSGVAIAVHGLIIGAAGPAGGAAETLRPRWRRTSSPLTLAGVTTTFNAIRANENSVAAIAATLKGCTQIGTTITEANAHWFSRIPLVGQGRATVIHSGNYPLVILAGSALEIWWGDNSATVGVHVDLIWDEV